MTSIAFIDLDIAYVTPTLLSRFRGKDGEAGRWSLGRWSVFVGWLGVTWVVVIAVLFTRREFNPVTRHLQRRPHRPGRRAPVPRRLLADLGPQVVHRAEGPGDRGRAGQHRPGFSRIEQQLEEID
ncbi:MAG: hypothetical protein ACRDY1_01345 [Acidimicrobiales bacterium]